MISNTFKQTDPMKTMDNKEQVITKSEHHKYPQRQHPHFNKQGREKKAKSLDISNLMQMVASGKGDSGVKDQVRMVVGDLEGVLSELQTVVGDLRVLVDQIDVVTNKIDKEYGCETPVKGKQVKTTKQYNKEYQKHLSIAQLEHIRPNDLHFSAKHLNIQKQLSNSIHDCSSLVFEQDQTVEIEQSKSKTPDSIMSLSSCDLNHNKKTKAPFKDKMKCSTNGLTHRMEDDNLNQTHKNSYVNIAPSGLLTHKSLYNSVSSPVINKIESGEEQESMKSAISDQLDPHHANCSQCSPSPDTDYCGVYERELELRLELEHNDQLDNYNGIDETNTAEMYSFIV